MSNRKVGFTIRLPLDLKEWLRELAVKKERSINGEVIVLLKKIQKDYEKNNINL